SIRESLSHVLEQWLLAGQLDIALLYDPPPSAGLELSPLTHQLLYLVGLRGAEPVDRDVSLHNISEFPLVIPNRPHTVRTLLETQMALAGCRPNIRLEIDGVSAILDLVADGAGYAVLTEHAVRTSAHPEQYQIRRIVQPELPSCLYLATAAERITTLSQTTMIGLIRGVVHELYPASMTHAD
ncbi:MAG: LysR substrate-binding domain-containing protein, partial [Rhodanobacteraceae bacterium]